MLQDGAESEPIFAAKVGFVEQALVFGRDKFAAPGLIKLLSKGTREALEIPVVVVELG